MICQFLFPDPSPPGPIKFMSVTHDTVSLNWQPPEGHTGSQRYRVTWKSENEEDLHCSQVPVANLCIQNLTPGRKYEFTIESISKSGVKGPSVSATRKTGEAS